MLKEKVKKLNEKEQDLAWTCEKMGGRWGGFTKNWRDVEGTPPWFEGTLRGRLALFFDITVLLGSA
jgi:hypothetical protein